MRFRRPPGGGRVAEEASAEGLSKGAGAPSPCWVAGKLSSGCRQSRNQEFCSSRMT